MEPGERVTVAGYDIEFIDSNQTILADHTQSVARVQVERDGKILGIYEPTQDFYPRFSIAPARAAIRSTPVEDLYIIPSDFFTDGSVRFRILVNPLVMWMWIAGPVMILGTLIALWPQRHRAFRPIEEATPVLRPTLAPLME